MWERDLLLGALRGDVALLRKALLEAAFNVNLRGGCRKVLEVPLDEFREIWEYPVEQGRGIDCDKVVCNVDATALHVAIRNGHRGAAAMLLHAGADYNALGREDQTCFNLSARKNEGWPKLNSPTWYTRLNAIYEQADPRRLGVDGREQYMFRYPSFVAVPPGERTDVLRYLFKAFLVKDVKALYELEDREQRAVLLRGVGRRIGSVGAASAGDAAAGGGAVGGCVVATSPYSAPSPSFAGGRLSRPSSGLRTTSSLMDTAAQRRKQAAPNDFPEGQKRRPFSAIESSGGGWRPGTPDRLVVGREHARRRSNNNLTGGATPTASSPGWRPTEAAPQHPVAAGAFTHAATCPAGLGRAGASAKARPSSAARIFPSSEVLLTDLTNALEAGLGEVEVGASLRCKTSWTLPESLVRSPRGGDAAGSPFDPDEGKQHAGVWRALVWIEFPSREKQLLAEALDPVEEKAQRTAFAAALTQVRNNNGGGQPRPAAPHSPQTGGGAGAVPSSVSPSAAGQVAHSPAESAAALPEFLGNTVSAPFAATAGVAAVASVGTADHHNSAEAAAGSAASETAAPNGGQSTTTEVLLRRAEEQDGPQADAILKDDATTTPLRQEAADREHTASSSPLLTEGDPIIATPPPRLSWATPPKAEALPGPDQLGSSAHRPDMHASTTEW